MSDLSQRRSLFELITGKAFAPPGKTYETGGSPGQLYGNMSDGAPSYMDKSANWMPPQGSQNAASSLYGNAQPMPTQQPMMGMPGSMQNINAMAGRQGGQSLSGMLGGGAAGSNSVIGKLGGKGGGA